MSLRVPIYGHVNVATACGGNVSVNDRPPSATPKDCAAALSLSTISAVEPSGLRNATP